MELSHAPRVLIVDDESDVRHLFGRFLHRSGMVVVFAENGIGGLAEARAHLPDAIVSDLCMPQMDGLAFCRALRRDPVTSGVPIVVISGDGAEQLSAARDAGCDAVLVKPCGGDLLVSTIEQLLELQHRRAAAQEPS